jgi:hypothetical protein
MSTLEEEDSILDQQTFRLVSECSAVELIYKFLFTTGDLPVV